MGAVWRECRQSGIVHGAADGEVIQRLKVGAFESEHLMHRIVEEAADASRPHAGGFRLEIEHLSDQPCFPE